MCTVEWWGQEENFLREMPQKVLRRDGAGVSQDHVPRYRDRHNARQTETEANREVTKCKTDHSGLKHVYLQYCFKEKNAQVACKGKHAKT